MRHLTSARLFAAIALGLLFPSIACAQNSPMPAANGNLVLVLPFENRSGQPALNWIGDSFPDTINQRLGSSGFLTISRDDRQYAYNHLGLPVDFRPTRATTLQIAQTMDADYVIVGSFKVVDNIITADAQIIQTNQLRMSQPIENSTELSHLFDVENTLAWVIARQIDPRFSVAQQTFLGASAGISLSSFESYIRGITATTAEERAARLKAAADSTPLYPAAILAYGKELYAQRQYEQASAVLARLPANNRLSLEAHFYLGLASFNSAHYADAETAFTFDATRLPLPEVVNDQGVAQARQGKDAAPLFQRAATADPSNPDYHYNLAVSLYRLNDLAGATTQVDDTLHLHPDDPDAATLKARLIAGTRYSATSDFVPLERIVRTYSEASFRQAASQLDEARAARLATLPPAEQAAQYTDIGRDYLAQGLLPEAEQQFQTALTADPSNALARAGLAQVREQSGDTAAARKEAQASLSLKPNVDAWLVLARLDLQANNLTAAAGEVHSALALDPQSSAALGMKQALESSGQHLP